MEKIRKTNLMKYGCENPMQHPEIQKRLLNNFLMNGGKIPSSVPEKQLINIIRSLGHICITGLQVGKYFPDGVLFYGDIKIDIEYDGLYWHKDKNKDDIRDLYFLENGYKILRIKANREAPSIDQVASSLNELINHDRYYYEI